VVLYIGTVIDPSASASESHPACNSFESYFISFSFNLERVLTS
jgi:hypothetical protein